MKTKSEYRILHQKGRAWLQFKHNDEWLYIKDNALDYRDCPTSIPWFSKDSLLSMTDDDFFTELWVVAYPNIEDYFERNKERIRKRREYENSIVYI